MFREVFAKNQKFILIVFVIHLATGAAVFAEPIPFSLKRGIPEFEVIINDSIKATFAIDTGADQVYIDKTFAEKHGLLSGGKMPMRPAAGINKKVEAFQIFLRSLKVGETKQTIVNAVVIDLPVIIKDTSKGLPDGVLGYSFLKNHRVLFSYIDSYFDFFTLDPDSIVKKYASIPIVLNRHLIVVNTTINDSIDAKMILDTGASHSIMSPSLAQKLKANDSTVVNQIKLDGRVTTAKLRFLIRDISTITASAKNEFDGVLGTSFLSGRQFIIDYKNSQLLIFANK